MHVTRAGANGDVIIRRSWLETGRTEACELA
jgi:hypothetical protein